MALTGFRRSCGKRSGGIRSVCLIKAGDLAQALYDADQDCYTAVATAVNAAFARYHFKEDEAVYSETVSYANGSYLVAHNLSFLLEKTDASTGGTVEELAEASPCGIVALVTTNNDVTFLVGYSEKFGAERAMRLEKSTGTTGRALSDLTAETVTLVSFDTSKSKVFTGTIPL